MLGKEDLDALHGHALPAGSQKRAEPTREGATPLDWKVAEQGPAFLPAR